MSERASVDACVVTWNTAELTAFALRRLLDTNQGCDLRVLVHDNASEDGTPERIAAMVPEAEIASSPVNLGFAAGVNRLLERSSSEWVLLMNSDAWPEEGAVGRLLDAGNSVPRCAAVAPRLERPDGGIEESLHPFPSLRLAALDALGARHWLPASLGDSWCLPGRFEYARARSVDWAVGAVLLIRRVALEEVGGLDERFFMYVEDLEWCHRARTRGWEIRFEPGARFIHRGNASGERKFGDRRSALENANLRTFLDRRWGRPRRIFYEGLVAAALAERACWARLRGREDDLHYWKGELKSLLGLIAAPVGVQGDAVGDEAIDGSVAGKSNDAVDGPLWSDGDGPLVTVVVPTHNRIDRLQGLVDALVAQTLPPAEFAVVMVDDGSTDGTDERLEKIAAGAGIDVTVLHTSRRRGPASARNAGWRAATSPVIAFTDDDCRPEPGWLAGGLAAMSSADVVVGRTRAPDPEDPVPTRPFARALMVDDVRFFETCNVFYRRDVLDASGGFDPRFTRPSGEDTELGLRVTSSGARVSFAPSAEVVHERRSGGLRQAIVEALRWSDLPLVVKGRPASRPELLYRSLFWKPTHPPAMLALAGILLAARRRSALLLTIPWVRLRLFRDPVCRGPMRRVKSLPGALALDITEVGVMIQGSLRHRSLVL